MRYELGPDNGRLTVRTGRAGLAARAGHDLVIEAERWHASVDPPSEGGTLRATVDTRSLRVREGLGGIKPLTDADRRDIERTIGQKILRSDRHPEISYESTAIQVLEDTSWRVDGRLTLAGQTVAVTLPVAVSGDGGAMTLRATAAIVQSEFGIKPYVGMMGALKVADRVEITVEATVSPFS